MRERSGPKKGRGARGLCRLASIERDVGPSSTFTAPDPPPFSSPPHPGHSVHVLPDTCHRLADFVHHVHTRLTGATEARTRGCIENIFTSQLCRITFVPLSSSLMRILSASVGWPSGLLRSMTFMETCQRLKPSSKKSGVRRSSNRSVSSASFRPRFIALREDKNARDVGRES